VVMVLSAGHCGMQWLAAGVSALYPHVAVAGEPIGPRYAPRRFFRRYEDPEAILSVPDVAAHVARIEQLDRPYMETGWPLFPVLPLLADRLRGRLRVVHVTRHPVPSALDHLADGSYAGGARNDPYTRLATLGPRDPGAFQPEYAATWDRLSPYEKCLFWWTEIGMFGLEFPGRFDWIPFLRIQAERLLAGDQDALGELLAFAELPWREEWRDRVESSVDRWRYPEDRTVNPLEVHRHPTTVDVASRLGYGLSDLTLGALLARYDGDPTYRP
jgi:hypothetical protein